MIILTAKSVRGRFRGVFPDYRTAEQAIPASKLVGYNHREIGKIYFNAMSKARDSDYPALFWLAKLLPHCRTVFDYGGNIGVSYYKFGNYLHFSPDIDWRVFDLPEICKVGEEVAVEKGSTSLKFTTRLEDADGIDIFFTTGSIQYIPEPLSTVISRLRVRPRHILINRVPLFDGPEFVTLEDVYPAVCAYQIFNRQRFLDSICELGYELVDVWTTLDLGCNVRWRPRHSFKAHSGLYFRQLP